MIKSTGGIAAALGLCVAWLVSSDASAQKALDVTIPGKDNRSYQARVFLPKETPAPAVLVLHTFYGVINGAAEKAELDFGQALAREGFVAVVPNYVDRSLRDRPHQPAIVTDLAEIANWSAARPEAAGKPVGVVGFSIGSILGARMMAQVPAVKAFVGYYGYYNYRTFPGTKGRQLAPGPVDLAPRIGAAVLLLHGTQDDETDIAQAQEFKAALEKASKPVELVSYSGATHRFDRGPNAKMKGEKSADGHIYRVDAKARDDAWKRTLGFLRENLK